MASRRSATLLVAAALAFPATAMGAAPGTNPDITWGGAVTQTDVNRTGAMMWHAGVQWVRTNVSWSGIEPRRGAANRDYLQRIDYAINLMNAASIDVVMPIADGVPYWASADPDKYRDGSGEAHYNVHYRPTRFSDYGDFVRFIVHRYSRMGVHVYEIWNEPDTKWFWPSGPDPETYVRMLKAGYRAVKAEDPHAKVLVGGLKQNDSRFLAGIYRAGGGPYFDAVSTHAYPAGPPEVCPLTASGLPARDALCGVRRIHSVLARHDNGRRRVWLTEFGWSTCSVCEQGVSVSTQADYLLRGFRFLERYRYLKAALEYNFRNTYFQHEEAGNWNAHTGLVRVDYTAKPALSAFRQYAIEWYAARKR